MPPEIKTVPTAKHALPCQLATANVYAPLGMLACHPVTALSVARIGTQSH